MLEMKPEFEKIPESETSSFHLLKIEQKHFDGVWHYHPEAELTWIESGEGIRCIGENMHSFNSNDLVLIGPKVPHFWDSKDFKRPNHSQGAKQSKAISIQWHLEKVLGKSDQWPEFLAIRKFINKPFAYSY